MQKVRVTSAYTARMFSPTKLRQARERAILSQGDLAQRAKLSRQTIARLEDGGPEPYPSTIRKLARALGVKPQDLTEAPA